MSVHMRKSGSVFVRYREGGKQKQKSFGSGKKAVVEARKFDRSVAEKKKLEEEQPLFAAVQSVTYVSELVDLYYGMEDENERKSWKNDWLKLFKKHVLPGLAQVPIEQLTQDGLVRLMRKAFPDASFVTRTTYLSYMKTMFNWALSREYIEKNPLAFVTRKYSPQKDF